MGDKRMKRRRNNNSSAVVIVIVVTLLALFLLRRTQQADLRYLPPVAALRANIPETSLVPLINEQGEKEKGRNEREFSWCCSFLWGFGCRGTERRRAKRAAARTLNMNDRLRVQVPYRACWGQL